MTLLADERLQNVAALLDARPPVYGHVRSAALNLFFSTPEVVFLKPARDGALFETGENDNVLRQISNYVYRI